MPLFQPEIRRPLVAKKHIAVADQQLINAHHRRFGCALSRTISADGNGGTESMRLEKRFDPLETPFQRAHDAIFITRGKPVFPVIHPARVSTFEHWP